MKKLLLSLLLLSMICSVAQAASPVTGIWDGLASYVSGNTKYDHQTHLYLSCDGTSGSAQYTYINFTNPVTCNSYLALQSIAADGTYTYADTTQSPNCTNGIVKVKKMTAFPFSGMLWFQWLKSSGTLENQGLLSHSSGVVCSPP